MCLQVVQELVLEQAVQFCYYGCEHDAAINLKDVAVVMWNSTRCSGV